MSFFTSFSQIVSDAGQSINAGARKLASTISHDSSEGNEPNYVITTNPAESPSNSGGNGNADLLLNGGRKRPTGPLLLPSPQLTASIPLSPNMKRRASLAVSPRNNGHQLEATKSSINLG